MRTIRNMIRPSAMGGYVMSPFGDLDANSIFNLIDTGLKTGQKIIDAVTPRAQPGQPSTGQFIPTGSYYPPNYQSQQAPADNTLLYVGGAAALVAVLVLMRR